MFGYSHIVMKFLLKIKTWSRKWGGALLPQNHEHSRILSVVVVPLFILTSMLYANLLAQTISEINMEY